MDETLRYERDLARLADLLFHLTDAKDWPAARALFADGPVELDMGEGPAETTADDILAAFAKALHPDKATHHLATNYLIDFDGAEAHLRANGYAWNLLEGRLWETWGAYRLSYRRTPEGWRLTALRYHPKHTRGDESVPKETR